MSEIKRNDLSGVDKIEPSVINENNNTVKPDDDSNTSEKTPEDPNPSLLESPHLVHNVCCAFNTDESDQESVYDNHFEDSVKISEGSNSSILEAPDLAHNICSNNGNTNAFNTNTSVGRDNPSSPLEYNYFSNLDSFNTSQSNSSYNPHLRPTNNYCANNGNIGSFNVGSFNVGSRFWSNFDKWDANF